MASTAVAKIRTAALQNNLYRAREAAPGCPVMAVVKANAYGHGLVATARALGDADAFGVARFEAALELRRAGVDKPIVVLSAILDRDALALACEHDLQVVVYDEENAEALADADATKPVRVWLKIDTGMGRLGIAPARVGTMVERLRASASVARELCLMTHLACADEIERVETDRQLRAFGDAIGDWEGDISIANSAGILGWPESVNPGPAVRFSGRNWIRPGLMLYGVSPLRGRTAGECGLDPVMSFEGRLLSVRDLRAGDTVGYGARWQAARNSRIGVVNVGYADGFPWRLSNRAAVRVAGSTAPVVGRVSMDMISIDLTDVPAAGAGDTVVLWGAEPTVGELAEIAGTSPYELLTGVGTRVVRRFE